MDEQNYTQGQLGGIVGKARTKVRDILTIIRLPQTIRDECRGIGQPPCQTFINIRIAQINLYSGTIMQYTGQHSGSKTIDTHVNYPKLKLLGL